MGLYSRLIWQSGIMLGYFTNAIDLVLPERRIVGLEGIVEAILAEPERHQVGAASRAGVDAGLGQIDGFAAHRRVGIGEGAELEGRVGVVAHGKAIDGKPEIAEFARDFRRLFSDMVGKVEIEIGQPSTLAARAAICISDGLPVRSGHSACGRDAKEFRRVAKRLAVMVDPSIVMTSHKYEYL